MTLGDLLSKGDQFAAEISDVALNVNEDWLFLYVNGTAEAQLSLDEPLCIPEGESASMHMAESQNEYFGMMVKFSFYVEGDTQCNHIVVESLGGEEDEIRIELFLKTT